MSNNNQLVPIHILNVYSSCNLKDKEVMWEEIIKIKSQENCKLWCVLGDFNVVIKINERKGVNLEGTDKKRNDRV